MWINSTHRELSRSPSRDLMQRLLRAGAHRQLAAGPPQIRFKLFRFRYRHPPVHARSSRTERAGRVQRARTEARTGCYLSVPLIIGKQEKKRSSESDDSRKEGTERTRLTEQRAPHIRCDATRIPGCCPTLGSRSDVDQRVGPSGSQANEGAAGLWCCGRLNSLHLTTEEATAGTAGSRFVPSFYRWYSFRFYVACMREAAVKENRFPRVFYRGPAFYFYVACMLCDCSEKDGTPKVFPTGVLPAHFFLLIRWLHACVPVIPVKKMFAGSVICGWKVFYLESSLYPYVACMLMTAVHELFVVKVSNTKSRSFTLKIIIVFSPHMRTETVGLCHSLVFCSPQALMKKLLGHCCFVNTTDDSDSKE